MKRTYFQIAAVVIIVIAAAYFAPQIMQNDTVMSIVDRLGYGGIFIIALISGFNIVVPIPAVVFTPLFLEAGYSFFFVAIVMALGMTSGDLLGYMIGHVTRSVVSEHTTSRRMTRLVHWAERHGRAAPYALLFVYATFAPGPNELLVIPMAFLGYRLKYMFPIVFIGNCFFVALGAFGIIQLVNIL